MCHKCGSNKDHKIASLALAEARESPVMMQVGCVATLNGKPIAQGHNHYRTHSKDKIICNTFTCHAECDVMHKLSNMFRHDPTRSSKVVQEGSALYR